MPPSTQQVRLVPGNHLMVGLLGQRDELLRLIEGGFPGNRIHVRGNEITIDGPDANQIGEIFEELISILERGHALDEGEVGRAIDMFKADERPSEVLTAEVLRSAKGKAVNPKSSGQKDYVDAIVNNVITFGIGPAGTGKSYLAVALAVQALQAKTVSRIILTRPAVEAGERLGFLPGDLMAKIDPYLRPLYDALNDMMEPEGVHRLMERGTIEVAPLAFMRGRTLNNSFVILDEAQNTTPEQMKMFLTRIGFGTKAVITGDVTQVDLAGGKSGLLGLERMLSGIDGLAFVHLDAKDVVRHRIVRDIVNAYEKSSAAMSSTQMTARVFTADEQDAHPVDTTKWMQLARNVLAAEGVWGDVEMTLMFVGEEAIAELNEQFMGKQGPTDVLSFPIDEEVRPEGRIPDAGTTSPTAGEDEEDVDDIPLLIGDVVICPAVAHRNAPNHAGNYEDELALLVVHGILHLLGMDHEEDEEAEVMEARERELLNEFHKPAAKGKKK